MFKMGISPSNCRQYSLVIVGVLLFFVTLAQCAQLDPTTITSSTELVLVPTIVNDKSGSHVSGLKKDDFVLKQDGKNYPITVFEEVKTTADRMHRSAGENGTFSNFEPGSGEHRRLSIIVLDLVNTPFADQASARQALLKFLSEAADSGEPMCLLALTPGGLTLIHDFTDDPKLLAKALRSVKSSNATLLSDPTVDAQHPPPAMRSVPCSPS